MEAAGLATVSIGLVRAHMEKVNPPRGLICDFPLGRPLGKPDDVPFQRAVLTSLLAMLESDKAVLQDYPEVVTDAGAEQLVCSLPPRVNSDDHPAVDEARALQDAYARAVTEHGNRVGACREIDAQQIPAAIQAFVRILQGTPWKEAQIPGNPSRVAHDIRGYYQTAALALAENSPAAWAGEKWFYESTETGKLMLAARSALKDAGAPQPLWFFLTPMDQPV